MSPPTKESMLAAYAAMQVQIDITITPSNSQQDPLGWTPTSPTVDSPTTCSIIVHSPSGRVVTPIFHDPDPKPYIPRTSYPNPPPAEAPLSQRCVTADGDYLAPCTQSKPDEPFQSQATEILPGLFMSDMHTATSAPALRALGITHVVAVVRDDWPLAAFPPGVRCLRIPAEDASRASQLGYMEQAVLWMARALEVPGSTVLIHCAALAVAYVMAHKEVALDAAWALVNGKCRIAHPSRGCVQQLMAFERRCRDVEKVRHRHLMAVKALVDDWKRYKKGRPNPDPFMSAGSKVLALS